MYQNILVGADGSETARRAVETAAELAGTLKATLHIVSAFETKDAPSGAYKSEEKLHAAESEVAALLQDLSFVAAKYGVDVVTHSELGDPVDVVVYFADQVGADLVVVGNRGMQGIRRVLGSVPNSVAHKAPCSVLIVETSE